MRARAWLWGLAALALCAAALAVLGRVGKHSGPGDVEVGIPPPALHAEPGVPGLRREDFVGAETCATCHRSIYDAWRRSTHGRAGGPPGPATVIAPFQGRPLRFRDATVIPVVRGGAYSFTVSWEGRPPQLFTVDGVVGGGHLAGGGTQGYLARFADGTLRLLPFEFIRAEGVWFCNTNTRLDRGWLPITPALGLADCGDWPPARIFGDVPKFANCQACHGSQIETAYDTVARRYDTRYTSLAVTCESCHGPARRHVELARSGRMAASADIGLPSLAGLSQQQSLEVCFRCHSLKDVARPGYLPGKPLAEHYALKFPLLGDRPLLPDGRVRTFAYQENQAWSDCALNGSMKCVDCHDPHSQRYRDVFGAPLVDRFADGQCIGCHASKAETPETHTRHARASLGGRCVSCHMPYLQELEVGRTLRYARSDHTVSIPRPTLDARLGVEGACRQCHLDRSPDSLEATVRRWYGVVKPHPSAVGGLLRAGLGDPKGLPDRRGGGGRGARSRGEAAALLLNPGSGHPMAEFAGLAEFFERHLAVDLPSLEPAARNRLERLAESADDDMAGLALSSLHLARGRDPAVRRFLIARLATLGAREGAVRRRWALALGFAGDRHRAEGALTPAITAYRRALEVLPGDPPLFLNLGLAYAAAGRHEAAAEHYRRSLAADPVQPLAHVNLGLALAALGDTAAAVGEFRRALAIDPHEPLAAVNLGDVAILRNDAAEAVRYYRQALASEPGLAPAHFRLARAEALRGRFREALAAVRDGLTFAPEDPVGLELQRELERLSGAGR